MKTFKRIFALLLALAMAFTFFACDNKKSDDDDDDGGESSKISTAEDALKTYYKSIENADEEDNIKIMPEFKKSYYGSNLEAEVAEELEDVLYDLEDDYGDDVKIEITNLKTKELKNKELKSIKSIYENDSDLEDIEIGEGSKISYDIKIEGEDDFDEGDGEAVLFKEDGKWKVYSVEIDF